MPYTKVGNPWVDGGAPALSAATLTQLESNIATAVTTEETARANADTALATTLALFDNVRSGTDAARTALTGSDLAEGLAFRTTDTRWLWVYTQGAWQPWEIPPTAYTPSLTNITGTTTARFSLTAGHLLRLHVNVTLTGAGITGAPQFTTPPAATTGGVLLTMDTFGHRFPLGTALLYDGTGTRALATVSVSTTTLCTIHALSASGAYVTQTDISATVPWTWAAGGQVTAQAVVHV